VAAALASEGDLEYAVGQLEPAAERYSRAVGLGESVMRDQPSNAANLAELATTFRHWGDLSGAGGMANLGRTADALRYYLRARDVADKLVLLRPDEWTARKARYSAQFKLATIEITTGHLAEGDRDLHLALTMIEQIAAGNPGNTHDQVEIANISGRLGVLSLSEAKPRDATPRMERSVAMLEALQRKDPEAVLFRHFLAVSQIHLATTLRLSGDPARALPHNLTAVALSEALSASGPKETEFRVDNACAHRDLAETLLALHDGPRAMKHAEKSVAILTGMTGMPSDVSLPAALGTALRTYGDTQAKANLLADALESYSLSISRLDPLASRDPANAVSQSDLAWSLARQGDCLARMGRRQASSAAYARATLLWNGLQNHQALTALDAARAHEVAMLASEVMKF
jgi:tetratricopeptide (TPR) repeat protein